MYSSFRARLYTFFCVVSLFISLLAREMHLLTANRSNADYPTDNCGILPGQLVWSSLHFLLVFVWSTSNGYTPRGTVQKEETKKKERRTIGSSCRSSANLSPFVIAFIPRTTNESVKKLLVLESAVFSGVKDPLISPGRE